MSLTPMMQQYFQVKERCPDCILFFRLGDFYEMFFKDAEIASRELELVLTGRDCGLEQRAPMCGIPHHAANNYIGRLVVKGFKVAICDQLEDPALAKGIVSRGIVKIITPGTFTDPTFVEENRNNYIMSIYIDEVEGFCGLCFADISTGEFYTTDFRYNLNLILDEIAKFKPVEALIQVGTDTDIIKEISNRTNISYTVKENNYFIDNASLNIENQFKDKSMSLKKDCVKYASNGVLNYIFETQKIALSNIVKLDYYSIVDYMSIDINSRRNLELTENIREKTKKGSLLWIIDKTSTSMGSRMLRKWLEQPLLNKVNIEHRLDAVEELVYNTALKEDLKDALKGVYDIERIIGKISSKAVNAKELTSLKMSVWKIPKIKDVTKKFDSFLLKDIHNNLDDLADIYNILERSILDSPSLSIKEGNIIKDGYNIEVDKLRLAKTHGKEWIAALENSEREVTGIKSLKIGYNRVFGYYIEISKANFSSIPEGRYFRKQTLANAERFITEDLKVMEEEILGAEEKLTNLEYELFMEVRDKIETHTERIKDSARLISELDCLGSLATIALENNFCKPLINMGGNIQITDGRHPVVEKMLDIGGFVSNNTVLNTLDEQLLLITGPNMAGKSTYMRQVALIVVLAQIGSFVPAKYANISICDKIFTRIGASDDLSSGKSTFMVEMWEVANILNNATQDSLILLDEVGRGTSTYDGLSIAWAVIEYICSNTLLKCKTLFATHYHELTKLEGIIEGVKNYCVSVTEICNEIVFLRKIIRGGADQSYGIEVAKLAGLPQELVDRAKDILSNLESSSSKTEQIGDEIPIKTMEHDNFISKIEKSYKLIEEKENYTPTRKSNKKSNSNILVQIDFTELEKNSLIKDISEIDVMNLTPMESMNMLYEIIKKAKCI